MKFFPPICIILIFLVARRISETKTDCLQSKPAPDMWLLSSISRACIAPETQRPWVQVPDWLPLARGKQTTNHKRETYSYVITQSIGIFRLGEKFSLFIQADLPNELNNLRTTVVDRTCFLLKQSAICPPVCIVIAMTR